MYTVKIPTAMALIEHTAIDMNEPVMLWGGPGLGKSEAVNQLAKKLNAVMVDIRLSQYDSVDLRGFPGVDATTSLTCWHPPSTLPFVGNNAFPDDQMIILFLDEMNSAVPAVLAPAYQIINDKRCGEFPLKPNVRIIAAGNREGDRGVTTRMPMPLANRFTHVEVAADVDAWCAWAQDAGHPAIGIAFMQFRKELLYTFDPAKTDKAFATPRTWNKALKYYASNMPEDVKMAAMAGAVGDGPSADFWTFVDTWHKIIPIADILKNPTKAPLPEEMGMRYAVAANISGHMENDKNLKPLCAYLSRMDAEFQVLAWHMSTRRTKNALFTTPEFQAYAKTLAAVFKGSGSGW